MTAEITRRINQEAGVSLRRIEATMRLLDEGATVPFIARYRKEATGALDEGRIRKIADCYAAHKRLEARRREVLAAIENQNRLTDDVRERIERAEDEHELDDLHLQYRSKRQSKANLARRRGLEPLADYIQSQSGPVPADQMALRYINFPRKVSSVAAALEGAGHILAERISQDAEYRKWLRELMRSQGAVEARVVKGKENQKTKYAMYYEFSEPVAKIPSHRMLAIRRGAREKILSYSIRIDDAIALAELEKRVSLDPGRPSAQIVRQAVADAYERLLKPAIQNEIRTELRARAENEAITVFEENLTALLLAPPAGAITVAGIDPSLKAASRLAVVDGEGKLLEHHAIALTRPESGHAPEPAPDGTAKATGTPPVPLHTPASETPDGGSPGPDAQPSAVSAPGTGRNGEAVPQAISPALESPALESPALEPASAATPEPVNAGAPAAPEADGPPEAAARATGSIEAAGPPPDATPEEPAATAVAAPEPPADPADVLLDILKRTGVRGVVVGNGAGSREVETVVRSVVEKNGLDVFVLVANEAGASVYASSRRARQELPGLDVAARGAVSIARRLQDPLAELVKIDPKSIGVGQYQHDVDQKKLKAGLETAVSMAVNRVGVDLNSASPDLLKYVSGLSGTLAETIVSHRKSHGPFADRSQLLQIAGIDGNVFQQASGFVRVQGGTNPLDRTAIHPESYPLVEKMAASIGAGVGDVLENSERIAAIDFESFEKEAGRFTLADIRRELEHPGQDPRQTFSAPRFRDDIRDIADLAEGMELEGTVTNVTNFGAFVDIGVHQDGLVHISELSHRYVSDARQAARVGDLIRVKVIGVDAGLKRISLSVKATLPKPQARRRPAGKPQPPGKGKSQDAGGGKTRDRRPRTREALAAGRKKTRKGPAKGPVAPVAPASMEEKIRQLQEKFKSPGS